jgi:magnesium chelatase accessory protein
MLGEEDIREWPNRAAGLRIAAGGIDWHVQRAGRGPCILLLHGTGASTHSWRGLLPILAERFDVIAPDLPGHAFTSPPPGGDHSMPAFAKAVAALLDRLGAEPVLGVGHSAGAAVLARMTLDGAVHPKGLVAINGALLPFGPYAGSLFSGLARMIAMAPLLPSIVARFVDAGTVRRLLADTGSKVDAEGLRLYARLFSEPSHVAATLRMMAMWDLAALKRDLPGLDAPFLLLAGTGDRTIPPDVSARVRDMIPHGRLEALPGLGHLAHEEDPESTAAAVIAFATTLGLSGDAR